jgi:ComF family protein
VTLPFLFPAPCVHCEELLEDPRGFLCKLCAELLPWIDVSSRCLRCFTKSCACASLQLPLYRRLAVFSYGGPIENLIYKFKFEEYDQLADLFASCLLVQIEKADLRWPDALIPIPHTPWHSFLRGYRSSELLAKALAKKMDVPVVKALRRAATSLPQRSKTKAQRESLSSETYLLRKGIDLTDRSVLLIDDLSTTGTTLARCAEALKNSFPIQVSACTLAIVD